MTPEERTEWVLWSVRNDPEIEAPTGQEAIAAHYIRDAIRAARREALEDAALVVATELAWERRNNEASNTPFRRGALAAFENVDSKLRGLVTDALKAPADSMSVHDPSTDDRIE